jgi:hypothetical protein
MGGVGKGSSSWAAAGTVANIPALMQMSEKKPDAFITFSPEYKNSGGPFKRVAARFEVDHCVPAVVGLYLIVVLERRDQPVIWRQILARVVNRGSAGGLLSAQVLPELLR